MATRKDEMKSAEFSCGRLRLGMEKNIKQKKKEKNTENTKKEVAVGEGVVGHGPQTVFVLSGARESADDCLGMKCGIRSGADGRLAMQKRHAATRSCKKFNLTAQMQSRFRQEGQGAVPARKEQRRSRHQRQIGGGGLHVYTRGTLGAWLLTGGIFYCYSCDTLA